MKNIHVLPTDKPSRLQKFINYVVDKIEFELCSKDEFFNKGQHIYITNDEEIKDGDWHLNIVTNKISKYNIGLLNPNRSSYKKIILTTDQDLIKDGVQAIDDEFLEWFVANPSCERVEVIYGVLKPFQSTDKGYIIHLPDNEVLEEPKFEDSIENSLSIMSIANDMFGKKEEPKQEICDNCNNDVCCCIIKEQRMYSEEEVRNIANWAFGFYRRNDLSDSELEDEFNRVLAEQFKKK
jgi:hypothetical protein